MAKKNVAKDLGTVVSDLVVDLSPDVMVVTTGKGKKQTVDEDATYENITTNIAYYAGMLNALDAISGEVEGLAEALDEHKEAYDILFAYAEENLDGFSEYADSYGLESFGTQDGDGEGIDLTELERSDLVAIAKQMGIKIVKKDTAESIIEKLEEADEDELDDALTELGYYGDDADEEDDEAGDDTEDEEEEESGYEDMSLGELRKECKAREIKYTPKEKAEALIAKLEADDEENGEEDEEDDGADEEEVSESELDEILDEEFEDETLAEEEKAAGKKSGKKLPKRK